MYILYQMCIVASVCGSNLNCILTTSRFQVTLCHLFSFLGHSPKLCTTRLVSTLRAYHIYHATVNLLYTCTCPMWWTGMCTIDWSGIVNIQCMIQINKCWCTSASSISRVTKRDMKLASFLALYHLIYWNWYLFCFFLSCKNASFHATWSHAIG